MRRELVTKSPAYDPTKHEIPVLIPKDADRIEYRLDSTDKTLWRAAFKMYGRSEWNIVIHRSASMKTPIFAEHRRLE